MIKYTQKAFPAGIISIIYGLTTQWLVNMMRLIVTTISDVAWNIKNYTQAEVVLLCKTKQASLQVFHLMFTY